MLAGASRRVCVCSVAASTTGIASNRTDSGEPPDATGTAGACACNRQAMSEITIKTRKADTDSLVIRSIRAGCC